MLLFYYKNTLSKNSFICYTHSRSDVMEKKELQTKYNDLFEKLNILGRSL